MASNYTENYQLNQWEPTDKVLREEFNADNAKIDAALAEVRGAALKVITGSWTGTGELAAIHYTVGARPRLLLVATSPGTNTGQLWVIATENIVLQFQRSGNGLLASGLIAFDDTGFTFDHSYNGTGAEYGLNQSGVVTHWWALC